MNCILINSNVSYLRTYIILGSADRPNTSDPKECLATEFSSMEERRCNWIKLNFHSQCDYFNQSICNIVLKLFQWWLKLAYWILQLSFFSYFLLTFVIANVCNHIIVLKPVPMMVLINNLFVMCVVPLNAKLGVINY